MDDDTLDRIAEAGYTAWRGSSRQLLRAWPFLPAAERYRWHLAADGMDAADIRARYCIGLFICPWEDVAPVYRMRWEQVADAMDIVRRMIRREAA